MKCSLKYSALFITVLIILSCSSKLDQPNLSIPDSLFQKHSEFTTVEIPLKAERPIYIEDLAEEVSFIPLESQQRALINRAVDLFTNDSLILINTRENIKYFNWNGDYQFTFENIGRGPSEYTTIFGMAVNFKNNLLAIADQRFVKLYDVKGNFLKTLELPDSPFSLTPNIIFWDSTHLLIENNRIKPFYQEGFSPLWSLDIDTEDYQPLFPHYADSVYRFQRKFTFSGDLIKSKNSIYYRSVDSYNVYAINSIDGNSNPMLRYRLDFGDRTMPPGALHDADNYNEYTERFARLHAIIETGQYVFIKYATGNNKENSELGYAIFDKVENEIIAHQTGKEGIRSNTYSNITFWPKYVDNQGRLISTHSAWDFANGEALKEIEKEDNLILSVITLK